MIVTSGVDELFERWRPTEEHAGEAGRLDRALDHYLFNEVCDAYRLRVRNQRFDVEESDPKMYPPDVYPVVYIDKQGRRYCVEVDVTVTALPSVEVEQQRGLELERQLASRESLHPEGGPGA
jgi:hypothetical protein